MLIEEILEFDPTLPDAPLFAGEAAPPAPTVIVYVVPVDKNVVAVNKPPAPPPPPPFIPPPPPPPATTRYEMLYAGESKPDEVNV